MIDIGQIWTFGILLKAPHSKILISVVDRFTYKTKKATLKEILIHNTKNKNTNTHKEKKFQDLSQSPHRKATLFDKTLGRLKYKE